MDLKLGLLLFACQVAVCLAGEYCYIDYEYEYCTYDCCGSYYDRYCCEPYAWVIAVAVIGSILFVSFIVVVLCCWYQHKNKRARAGHVIAPHTSTVTTVSYGQPVMIHGTQPYGYMQQTPGYPPPPASTSTHPQPDGYQHRSDPVYPPPPANY